MRLVALTLARNEDWIIELSAFAAAKWCDAMVLIDHASSDNTVEAWRKGAIRAGKDPRDLMIGTWKELDRWDEMDARHFSLRLGREIGGTHFAIVDADEVLTSNMNERVREAVRKLPPSFELQVPMVPVWRDLDHYRSDDCVWSRAWLTVAFHDEPSLTWKPAEDGYHHHHRSPYGIRAVMSEGVRGEGGGMHLQFANRRRIIAKHVLYRMTDLLRWPARESAVELNRKYSQALDERNMSLSVTPEYWWKDYNKGAVQLNSVPWQEDEIRRLISIYGRERFDGLDLLGF